jgi:hypothetical protein
MAAPNVAAQTSRSPGAGAASSLTITLPAGTQAGDLVLAFVALSEGSVTDFTDGWTLVTSGGGGYVYGRVVEDGDSDPVVTFSASVRATWGAYRYDGSTGGAFDIASVEASSWYQAGGGYPNPPALSPSWGSAECSWIVFLRSTYVVFPGDLAWPSGWTGDHINTYTDGASVGVNCSVGTKDATASSQDPGTWAHGYGYSSHQNSAVTLAVTFRPDRVFTPSSFGAEAGFQSGVELVVSEDVTLFPEPMGSEAGFQPGIVFRTAGERQVALVAGGLKTPEATTGGEEGQVLTFHEGSVPTWDDVTAPASALDDLTDVDAPAPNDNDVLSWDDASGTWMPVPAGAPDLSAAILDDIGDVNAPAPGDGDVLTWDSTPGEWVALAPAAGGDITTDPAWTSAGDLIVATGDDAASILPVGDEDDVLTVVSGVPAWAAPASGDVPPALRVYLYSTFR